MVYCSNQDVANELRLSGFDGTTTPTVAVVDEWIVQASDEIDHITGMSWEQKNETVKLDHDGSGIVFTPFKPIITVNSLRYNKYNEKSKTQELVTLTEGRGNDFIVYNEEGEIHLNIPVPAGKQVFEIDYDYGYSTVPNIIKKLCIWMVAKRVILSLMNSQVNTEGGSVKIGNISISDPTMFSINYLKTLDEQINSTLEDLNKSHTIRYIRY